MYSSRWWDKGQGQEHNLIIISIEGLIYYSTWWLTDQIRDWCLCSCFKFLTLMFSLLYHCGVCFDPIRIWLVIFFLNDRSFITIGQFFTFLVSPCMWNMWFDEPYFDSVAVSCGYDTCFAVRACDGLYHFIFSIDRVGKPFGLYSGIDHLHLSIEAQCVSHLLPLGDHGDCHNSIEHILEVCIQKKLYNTNEIFFILISQYLYMYHTSGTLSETETYLACFISDCMQFWSQKRPQSVFYSAIVRLKDLTWRAQI